jgi:hypothetical protein
MYLLLFEAAKLGKTNFESMGKRESGKARNQGAKHVLA